LIVISPGEVVEPANDVDVVVVDRFLSQSVVLQIEYRQLVVDEQVLRQVLEVTAGQVGDRRQLVRRLCTDAAAALQFSNISIASITIDTRSAADPAPPQRPPHAHARSSVRTPHLSSAYC